MNDISIFIGGVGGQGLVLMTKILSEAVASLGFDVKTNDVVGLSQRGGKIWGTVKFGGKIHSPNILPSGADYLIGLEPLEAYRWINNLKPDGICIMNTSKIYPSMVALEKLEYPSNIEQVFSEKHTVMSLDATAQAVSLGNSKISNAVILGLLCQSLDKKYGELIKPARFYDALKLSLEENAPEKALELNREAFDYGYNYKP